MDFAKEDLQSITYSSAGETVGDFEVILREGQGGAPISIDFEQVFRYQGDLYYKTTFQSSYIQNNRIRPYENDGDTISCPEVTITEESFITYEEV